MAPSRRRGVSKASSAAAAAAARRQWKVGDLVLAKVKGFPAWPATVSEPKKWGYSTDWKKVLVYFFGTKQIAFCNPADVEAFTEEKKKSLLTKRHGKGADFGRALKEIIDCYENSKAPEQDDEGNSGHEDIDSNAGNSEGSGGRTGTKLQARSPSSERNSLLESLSISSHHPLEVSAATEIANLKDRQKTYEGPDENASSVDYLKKTISAATNSLKRKSKDAGLQSFVVQKRASARRSRSTLKVDPSKFQSHLQPLTDSSMDDGDLVPNGIHERSTRRNRRAKKLPDSYVWHETMSPGYSTALVSNGSSEGNDAEIALANSDTVSFNEDSTLESSCKSEHRRIDSLEKDVQISNRLHLRDEGVVLKKKRKPNRKRASHDAAASTFSPKKESGMELLPFKVVENSASVWEKVHESTSRANGEEQLLCVLPNSPNACEKVCEHISKADGDEHLPLVKRARVRMGKPPSEEKQPTDCPVYTERKSMQEALVNHSKPMFSPSTCAKNSHGSGDVTSVDKQPPSENKQLTRAEKLPTDCSIAQEGKSMQEALVNHSQPTSLPSACANYSRRSVAMIASMGKPLPKEKQSTDLLFKKGISMQEALVNHSQPTSSPSINNSHSSGMTLEVLLPPNCVDHVESEPPLWKASKYQPNGSADGEAALPPSKRLHRALEAMSANAVEDGQIYIEDGETPKALSSSGCSGSSEKGLSHVSMEDKVKSVANMEDLTSGDNGTRINGGVRFSPDFTSHAPEVEISSEVKPCDPPVGFSVSPEHGNVNMMMMKTRNLVDVKNIEASSVTTSSDLGETNLKSLQSFSGIDQKQDVHESSVYTLNHVSPAEKGNKHGILGGFTESTDKIFKMEFAHSLEEKSGQEQGATRPKRPILDSLSEVKEVGMLSTRSGDNSVLSIANGDSCKDQELLMSSPHEKVEGMYEGLTEVEDDVAYNDIDALSYSTSMKELIAAAQAKRCLSRSTSVSESVMVCDAVPSSPFGRRKDSYEKASPPHNTILRVSTAESRNHPLHNGSGSPNALPHFKKATHAEMDEGNVGESSSHRQKTLGKWASSEASAARKAFESMLGTLTRTKESIGRATRLAIDCAKYGIASEVLEILVRKLESESSLHRRVDLFFLIDSITQCSRGQKGGVGEVYPSAVQAVLPRLLSAAAPPGSAARENRKQCLKVLRLWLERKTLPESIIRHHMRELDSNTDVSYSSARSRRPSRMERAMNDPIREMEGMLVDEYGSNASFNLPGFSMPRVLEDEEGSDADERSFEALTPEPDPEIGSERESSTPVSTIEKHTRILEDVDGELEMEDVAPSHNVERSSAGDIVGVDAVHPLHCHVEQHIPASFAPPLPEDHPPSPPPLPSSPPPMPPAFPPTQSSVHHPFTECADSNLYGSTHGMQTLQSHLQQHISQPPCTSGVKSMVLDTVHNYTPGYRDFGKQAPRPSSSSIPGSSRSFSIPQVHMLTGNSVQHIDRVQHVDSASLRNQNCHVQPPPPTLSNQFSYVHADQGRQSWLETSSSFPKRYQFRPDWESRYDTRERVEMAPVEIGGRISAPMHSGLGKSDNPEASYVPITHYGPPRGPRILDRGWSFPPREVNYRHPTPSRPQCTIAGANGAPNYWIPR